MLGGDGRRFAVADNERLAGFPGNLYSALQAVPTAFIAFSVDKWGGVAVYEAVAVAGFGREFQGGAVDVGYLLPAGGNEGVNRRV